jgi:broad specificity phosphatase PhoE
MELEREKNDVLIIAHDSILRCLYAYLFDRPDSVSASVIIDQLGLTIVMTVLHINRKFPLYLCLGQH